ncbi:MAG: hypothetical protein HQK54_04165 [Oligoflexales bacterium]|nr:hypothetical protein [Oligoflexales bacterium]
MNSSSRHILSGKMFFSIVFASIILKLTKVFYIDKLPILRQSRAEEAPVYTILLPWEAFPEYREVILFISIIVFFPILVFFLRALLQTDFFDKIFNRLITPFFSRFYNVIVLLSFTALAWYVAKLANLVDPTVDRTGLTLYFPYGLLSSNPLFIAFLMLVCYLLPEFMSSDFLKKIDKYSLVAILPITSYFLFIIICYPLFNAKTADSISFSMHLEAYYFDVVQFFLNGGVGTKDFATLYGLYPVFLYPILKIFGLSVFNFTLIMGIISALSFLFAFLAIRKLTGSNILGFFVFLASLYGYSFPKAEFPDRYLQYIPHRLICPFLLFFLVSCYLKNRSRLSSVITTIFVSLAPFWSNDSGIICWISWFLFQSLEALDDYKNREWKELPKSLFRIFEVLAISLITIAGFLLIVYLLFGYWINPKMLFELPAEFGSFGFFMIPMPKNGLWQFFIILYLIAIFIAMSDFFSGKLNTAKKFLFVVGLYSIGSLLYYMGRSHALNLGNIAIFMPMPLITLFYVYWEKRKEDLFYRMTTIGSFFILAVFIVGLYSSFPAFKTNAINNMTQSLKKENGELYKRTSYLKERLRGRSSVLLISENLGVLLGEANIASKYNYNIYAIFLLKDYYKLQEFVLDPKNDIVIIDESPFPQLALIRYSLLPVINNYYVLSEKHHGFSIYERKNNGKKSDSNF